MKIKFYVFLLSMFVSWMSFAGSRGLPTYTISDVYSLQNGVSAKVVGRTIFVNITNPVVFATALGFNFRTSPSANNFTLTGVGTIGGNNSIQNYQDNTELSVGFGNGTVVKYTVKVTKDVPPALGTFTGNTFNINNVYVTTVLGGGSWQSVPSYNCLVSYNKITCSVPANLSVTSLYFAGYIQDYPNYTISGLSNAGLMLVGSNGFFNSTSLLGINELTTVTATAPNGETRNYQFSFVANNTVFDNTLTNIYSNEWNISREQNSNIEYLYREPSTQTVSSINFQISPEATITVVGGNISEVSEDLINNPGIYQITLTLPSADFNIIVTSKDGIAKTYKALIVDKFSEPYINPQQRSLDITNIGIANIESQKIDNVFYLSFPYNYVPFINGVQVDTYVRLNQRGRNIGYSN